MKTVSKNHAWSSAEEWCCWPGVRPPARLLPVCYRETQDAIHSFRQHPQADALPGPGSVPEARNSKVNGARASNRATHTPLPGTHAPKPTLHKRADRPRWLLAGGRGGDVCLSPSCARAPAPTSARDTSPAFSLSRAKPGRWAKTAGATHSATRLCHHLPAVPPDFPLLQADDSWVISPLNSRLRRQLPPGHFHPGTELVPRT